MFVFLCLVIGLGWAISWYFNSPAILVVAVVVAVVMNIASYWYSDKLVIASARATPASPEQYPVLNRVVENLCITAGLPKPKLYIINDPQPNAFATAIVLHVVSLGPRVLLGAVAAASLRKRRDGRFGF